MNTKLIHRSTRLVQDLSRPKPLQLVPGIEGCDRRLLWTVRTWLPLFVFPTLSAIIAAAPWYILGSAQAAFIAMFVICVLALRQARFDRQWFDAYTDVITRPSKRRLNNSFLRRFLLAEYVRPLQRPVAWIALWCFLPFHYSWIPWFMTKFQGNSAAYSVVQPWMPALAPAAITLGAAAIATRRRRKHQLPRVKPYEKHIVPTPKYGPTYLRGAQLITAEEARRRQCKILPREDHGIMWGGVLLPSDWCDNFCILAVTRGGKSIVLRLLMQDILCRVANPLTNTRIRMRALVYDPKPELLPYIAAIQPYAPRIITNASDLRSFAWDLAKDFSNIASAQQLSAMLVPFHLEQRDNFYPKAVRAVLTDVFKAFMLTTPGKWTLRDAFEVMKSEDDLKHLLDRHPETRGTLEMISRNAETRGNIDISIHVDLAHYKTLAARWFHAVGSFSLKDWIDGESILIVGRRQQESELFDGLNSLLLNRASDLLISQPDAPDIRTTLFLDELPTANGFRRLEMLMTNGLSKYVSVILASQGIEGLRQQFGNESTETILSMCSNKAFLRLSRATAEWAANQIGKTDWLEIYHNWSETSGTSWNSGSSTCNGVTTTQSGIGGSYSSTYGGSQQRNERFAQLPEEFQHIAKPNKTMNVGLRGTFVSDPGSAYGIVPTEIPAESLFDRLLLPADLDTPAFIERPAEHDLLPPWTDEDRKRLGFPTVNAQRAPLDTFLK